MITLGIDVGGSTTKIVGVENGEIRAPQCITAADPVTSLFGAFGKYIYDNGISLSDIDHVMLTGVGSAYISSPLYGLPTSKVDEFMANARGAGYRSGLDRMVVVSMGTGTSFVLVDGNSVTHLGGLALGGGTLQGLAGLLLKTSDIRKVIALAMKGDVRTVDLNIGDICKSDLPGLPLDVTASNFGKADQTSSPEDIAAGLVNMIYQAIGSSANFIAGNTGVEDFVLIGNMSLLPQCASQFERIAGLYRLRFHIPEHREYRTALGAALSHICSHAVCSASEDSGPVTGAEDLKNENVNKTIELWQSVTKKQV